MKKLLAIVLAVVMCTAALLTCVSAEDVAVGTEFNLTGKNKNEAFTFGYIAREDGAWGSDDIATSKFAPFEKKGANTGVTTDGCSTTLGSIFYNGASAPTQFGWGQPACAQSMVIDSMGSMLLWVAAYDLKVIKFTAPVDGTYTVSANPFSFWGAYVATCVGEGNLVKKVSFEESKVNIPYTETFSLKAGDAFYFGIGRISSGDKDDIVTYYEESFKITLDKLGYDEPENPGTGTDTPEFTPVVYDFAANFENIADANFSVAQRKIEDGTLEALSNFSDGTGTIICASSHKSLVGYYLSTTNIAQGDRAHAAVFYSTGDNNKQLKWYPANAEFETVIIFTAPESGKYTFELAGGTMWGTPNSSAKFYVEVAGEVVAEQAFAKGIAVADTNYTLTGEVTLKAGETIIFVTNPEDSAAGDNGEIDSLKVTLTEKIVDNDPPKTNDALVAVIALAAVAGTALVISKKH